MNIVLHRILVTAIFLLPAVAGAQSDIRSERVHFDPGTNGSTIKGSIKGYETIDYVLRANEGQLMNARMSTDNTANYFNILAPGEDSAAMFIGSNSENQFEGALPATGDYKLRVYLMRSAARRNEIAKYSLEIVITGDVRHSDDDALVATTEYHATGRVPCATKAGQPMGSCEFGVRRQGGGTGIVNVTRPNGSTLYVVYENGEIISAGGDASFNEQSDGESFDVRREADLTYLSIGDERYEIPDAVINGG